MSPHVRTALALTALFLALCVFSEGGLVTDSLWGDVGHYEGFARKILDGDLPYGDFTVEYPPFALPAFIAPALVTSNAPDYLFVFKLLMAACGVVVLVATGVSLARFGASRRRTVAALGTIALAPLLLGHVFLNRYDLWPTALVAVAVAAYLGRRETVGSAFLAGSFAAKIFTVSMLPLAAARIVATRGRRALGRNVAVFAVVCVGIFGFFLVTSFGGLGFSYWTQASRDLHTESLPGSILLALSTLGLYTASIVPGDPGSLDLDGTLPDVLATLTSVAAAATIAWVWLACRRSLRSDAILVAGFAAAAVAFLALAKVISPQFVTWLLPLVPLVEGPAGALAIALLLAVMPLTQLELRGWEGLHVEAWAVWILLARNVLLVVLLVVLLREVRRLVRDADQASTSAASTSSSASRRVRSRATSCARRTLSSVSRERTVE